MNPKLSTLMEHVMAARHEAARLMMFDKTAGFETKRDAEAIFRMLSGAAAVAADNGERRDVPSRDWCRALLVSTPEEAIALFWERRGFKCNGGGILPSVSAKELEKNLMTAWREFSSIEKDRVSGTCVPIVPSMPV